MFVNVFYDITFLCLPFAVVDILTSRSKKQSTTVKIIGNICFFIICGIVFFYSYFRDSFVGADSLNNYNAFNFILSNPELSIYEIGYVWFVEFFQFFSVEFSEFIKFCTMIILIPIFYVINKYPYRSFLLILFILGELNATFDVLKGFIAFAFIIIGFYIWNEKGKKYGIFIAAISLFFHMSSLFFILIFIMSDYIKKRKTFIWISVIAILGVATPLLNSILNTILNWVGSISTRYLGYIDTFGKEVDFSPTYILIYFIPNILGFVYFPKFHFLREIDFKNDNIDEYGKLDGIRKIISINWILLIVSIISTWMPVMHRYLKLSMIFNYILIGNCINQEKKLQNRLIIMAMVLVSNLLFAYVNNGGFIYKFGF